MPLVYFERERFNYKVVEPDKEEFYYYVYLCDNCNHKVLAYNYCSNCGKEIILTDKEKLDIENDDKTDFYR